MAVTLVDIARELKLSHATVSRVLNDRPNQFITEGTRRLVKATARRMGYRPNRLAQALVTGRTNRIAYLSFLMTWKTILEAGFNLQKLLKKEGYETFFAEYDPQGPVSEESLGGTLGEVDGIVLWLGGWTDACFRDLVQQGGWSVPIVAIGEKSSCGLDYVDFDLSASAVSAVQFLVDQGRRRIAYLTFEHTRLADQRSLAFRNVMKKTGMRPECIAIPSESRYLNLPELYKFIKGHFNRNGVPDGLFCLTDELTIAASRALRELGKRVPEDVGLTSCGGIQDIDFLSSGVRCIQLPFDEISRVAWRFLKNRIKKPDLAQQTHVVSGSF
jgi:LacI family transcriptional regulator